MAELPTGTVTFLFTDLESSTRLWESHAEEMRVALARHDALLRQAIEAHGGHVVKTTGDGVHAVFGVAEAAVSAAVEAQRSIGTETWPEGVPIRVRMGLNTGSAQARDGDYFGSALNRGARVMAIAHGGQILVSRATADLVRDSEVADMSVDDLGEHQLRDLTRPERVFQIGSPGLEADFPPLRSLEAFPSNLPTQFTSFVGRDDELAELTALLPRARLLTIVGVGGVGKTRLAAQVAGEVVPAFADGAWFAELGAADDADAITEVVATALAVQARPGMSLADSTIEFLRTKRLLLVLDNCEHLLDAVGRLVISILRECPSVQVTVTSREGLGVPGEQMWALRSLSLPDAASPLDDVAASDAVRLFVERAQAARSAFQLAAENAAHVAEICRRLDGVPLAIELAAARIASMNPEDIAARLDERFRLLTGGRHAAVGRQQTLLATVEWSYSLLQPREQLLFDRIGIFAGGFDPAAAEAIVTGDGLEGWDVLDGLAELVAKSMLSVDDAATGSVRYQLLETLREYSRWRMEEARDADVWRRRHAAHYGEFTQRTSEGLGGPDEVSWANQFEAELDNLRTAVSWALDSDVAADAELGLRIIGVLAAFPTAEGPSKIGTWAERALGCLDPVDDGLASAVLGVAAMAAFSRGDLSAMSDRARASLRRGPTPAWPHVLGHVATALGHAFAGELEDALQTWREATVVCAGVRPALRAAVHGGCSTFAVFAGDAELARSEAELAVSLARESGSPSAVAQALGSTAYVYRTSDPQRAREDGEEAIELMRAGAGTVLMVPTLANVALLRARAGDRVGAFLALHEATTRAHNVGDRPGLVSLLNRAGVPALAELGHAAEAAELAGVVTEGPLHALTLGGADADDRAAAIAILQAQLPATAYRDAAARGASMSYEAVVRYVLDATLRLAEEATTTPE